jgi:hypothetical protein
MLTRQTWFTGGSIRRPMVSGSRPNTLTCWPSCARWIRQTQSPGTSRVANASYL